MIWLQHIRSNKPPNNNIQCPNDEKIDLILVVVNIIAVCCRRIAVKTTLSSTKLQICSTSSLTFMRIEVTFDCKTMYYEMIDYG